MLKALKTRGRHGTGTLSRKIFGPGDSRPGFFSPRDCPGFFCPAGLVSRVISDFESRVPSRVPNVLNFSPASRPGSRIFHISCPGPSPGPGIHRNPGCPASPVVSRLSRILKWKKNARIKRKQILNKTYSTYVTNEPWYFKYPKIFSKRKIFNSWCPKCLTIRIQALVIWRPISEQSDRLPAVSYV